MKVQFHTEMQKQTQCWLCPQFWFWQQIFLCHILGTKELVWLFQIQLLIMDLFVWKIRGAASWFRCLCACASVLYYYKIATGFKDVTDMCKAVILQTYTLLFMLRICPGGWWQHQEKKNKWPFLVCGIKKIRKYWNRNSSFSYTQ